MEILEKLNKTIHTFSLSMLCQQLTTHPHAPLVVYLPRSRAFYTLIHLILWSRLEDYCYFTGKDTELWKSTNPKPHS